QDAALARGRNSFLAEPGFLRRRHAQGRRDRSAGAHARRYTRGGESADTDRLPVHRRGKSRDRSVERPDIAAVAAAAHPDRGFGAEPETAPAADIAQL